ncbi:MAG: rRNA pseudouridine synthase [Phycisphaerae bacterium]|nr:rRNA pseudouridine synthase [Phycisphaerae bacterium]
MEKIRIQKVLAAAGVASRRAVEQIVLEGRVSVNGQVVSELPCFVTEEDEIRVDGQVVRNRAEKKVYILLNKPRGVICTQRDETGQNRPRAIDLVDWEGQRLYCVGRLDADSTGLIVLTNDGELTNRLTHPRYGVMKTYVARVAGRVTGEDIATLRRGIFLGPQKPSPGEAKRRKQISPARASVKIIRRGSSESLLELRISEGRNRQVRRMLARLEHKVYRLHRSAIGPIIDRGLKIGRFRRLKTSEISALRKTAGIRLPNH